MRAAAYIHHQLRLKSRAHTLTAFATPASRTFLASSRSPFILHVRCRLHYASTTTEKQSSRRRLRNNEIGRVNAEESHVKLRQLSTFNGSAEHVFCDLLGEVKDIINPADVPKVERALLELRSSNYSEQLKNLGVRPPNPGWSLEELLGNDAYLDKERYYRNLVYEYPDTASGYRKSFVSYPRRWGKTVMIQAVAKILRWGSVKVSEGPLNEAKQPVLMLDWSGMSIDGLASYICDEIDGLAEVECLYDPSVTSKKLRSYIDKEDAVLAVREIAKALEARDRNRPLHILIDEYDFPVVEAINPLDKNEYDKCMKFYRKFFAATKSVKGAIVVTGVSRIGMAGIFSGANHLDDVTFKPAFEGLLGLSWREVVTYYGKALPLIARMNNLNSIEELKQEMIRWYDGYRWNVSGLGCSWETLFNPFSVHNLVREGKLEPYWARSGHSGWILTQEVCKALLRSMTEAFKISLEEILAKRIEYKDLGVDGDSSKSMSGPSFDMKKNRLLVALHAGYLTPKGVDVDANTVDLCIPNEEISSTVLGLLNAGNSRWKRDLDYGLTKDDVRLMMKGLAGEDGFLQFWREGAIVDPWVVHEKVMDISEVWLEKMMSFMFHLGNVPTAKTQFKVPTGETTPGAHPTLDITFNGTKFAHVVELKNNGADLDEVVSGQLQGYARSGRLKGLLDDWQKPALFWVVYFDASHLGKKEDVADVRLINIWAEGPYEAGKDEKLQLREK